MSTEPIFCKPEFYVDQIALCLPLPPLLENLMLLVEYCVRLIVVVVIGINVAAVTMVVDVVSVVSLLFLVLLFLKLMTT